MCLLLKYAFDYMQVRLYMYNTCIRLFKIIVANIMLASHRVTRDIPTLIKDLLLRSMSEVGGPAAHS